MIAALLHRASRAVRLALLRARLAQLHLAAQHVAITYPTDRVARLHIGALIAEVGLEITLMKAQP